MTYEDFPACFLPGWDEGDDGTNGSLMCELTNGHEGEHGAFVGLSMEVRWPVTWVVEDDGGKPDASYSMSEDPRGN